MTGAACSAVAHSPGAGGLLHVLAFGVICKSWSAVISLFPLPDAEARTARERARGLARLLAFMLICIQRMDRQI